jgi:hypothetical protein
MLSVYWFWFIDIINRPVPGSASLIMQNSTHPMCCYFRRDVTTPSRSVRCHWINPPPSPRRNYALYKTGQCVACGVTLRGAICNHSWTSGLVSLDTVTANSFRVEVFGLNRVKVMDSLWCYMWYVLAEFASENDTSSWKAFRLNEWGVNVLTGFILLNRVQWRALLNTVVNHRVP